MTSLSEIGPAMKLAAERSMLPPQADIIGQLVLSVGDECAHRITLSWDQWAVCIIKCLHGEHKGTSDFLNLTEAVLRAAEKFRKADHSGDVSDSDE